MLIHNCPKLIEFSLALTAGILLPLGLPPVNFVPLSVLGASLLFARTQLNIDRAISITIPGFAFGYAITGQFWFLWHQAFFVQSHTIPSAIELLCSLFVTPFLSIATIFGAYPICRMALDIPRFSTGSAVLFSCFWVIHEVVYSLVSTTQPPLLIAGYSIIGFGSDSLFPVMGPYGGSFFLMLVASLVGCLSYQFSKKRPRHILAFIFVLISILTIPLVCSLHDWTVPYDRRPFTYAMQTRIDVDQIQSTLDNSPGSDSPKLVILGNTFSKDENNNWPEYLSVLDAYCHAAFLAKFTSNQESCPTYYCTFGEGDGCTCVYHRRPSEEVPKAGLPIHNPSTFRHPAVDAYRIMITGNTDDLNPFYVSGLAVGAEAIVIYDVPVGSKVLQDRLLRVSQSRALETGRPVLRYSDQGLAAEINHKGIVKARYYPEHGLVSGQIIAMTKLTPFMLLGPYAPLSVVSLCLIVFGYRRLFHSL